MLKTDYLVIGGGCNGSSIAYHLARMGAKNVTLVERRTLASGGTGLSSAIVRLHYSTEDTAKLALKSFQFLRRFKEETGTDPGLRQVGFLALAGPNQDRSLRENVKMQQGLGINTKILSPDELKALEPAMRIDDIATAAYEPDSGYADPVAVTQGFAQKATQMGATILESTKVSKIIIVGDNVKGVSTDKGEIQARVVVNAAGPWGAKLMHDLHLECPVEVTRSQVLLFKKPTEFGYVHRVAGDFLNQIYYRPEGETMTLVGTLDPRMEPPIPDLDNYPVGVDYSFVEYASSKIAERYPVMKQGSVWRGWSGPYDVTPDWHPALSAVDDVEGLYCAIGFSGHGFKLSPAVGEVMAQLIMEGKARDIDIRKFRLSRFKEGEFIKGRYETKIVA